MVEVEKELGYETEREVGGESFEQGRGGEGVGGGEGFEGGGAGEFKSLETRVSKGSTRRN